MYSVIEYSSSVRIYDRIEEVSDVIKFNSLEEIYEKYIDVDYVKSWFGNGVDDIDISIDDVLEMKDNIGIMSVNEDMSLYIFKNEDLCGLLEDYIFELELKVKGVK